MSFLAPLFILGVISVGLPIVFHLIRRSSRERVPFSSLMFLTPSPPRVTRRSKIENIFLLILRCLVIGLLAFAFARPFLSKPVTPDLSAQSGERIVILLDTSASMRRAGLWTEAQNRAKRALRNVKLADQVACLAFDREVRSLVSFEQWSATPPSDRAILAAKQLDQTNPGWGSTRLGPALLTAVEALEATGKEDQRPKRIVLITDLQEGSRLDGLQGFEWPRGIEVSVEPLKASRPTNAGLQLASEREDLDKSTGEAGPRVRIINSSESKREQFQVGWRAGGAPAFIGETVDSYIPPGQSRVITAPKVASPTAADRLALTGDDEDFDNTVFVVPSKAQKARILFLGGAEEANTSSALYFVKRAFQETHKLSVEVMLRAPESILSTEELGSSKLVIINRALPESQSAALKRFVEADNSVLVLLSSPAMAPTLGQLLGVTGLSAVEATGGSYAMLAQIDFSHPLFAPFADPRYSDFTKIHFWKHRQISLERVPNARLLARFDGGDLALGEIPVGKGRVWVLTSGWQPEDSQLALSSKFVPLLYALLEQSGGIKESRNQYLVGEQVILPVDAESVTVRKPDASEVTLARGDKFTGTDQPGIYTVSSTQPLMSFAVNLTPEECKTGALPLEQLERLGVPLQHQLISSPQRLQERTEHLQAAQLENRQKLWRWLIVAALVVLVMETWLAGRLTHRHQPALEG